MESKKKDYFDLVGKQMPYRTPDNFFEQSGRQLHVALDNHQKTNSHRWWYGIAAGITLLVGIYSIVNHINHSAAVAPLYSQTTNNTAEDWSDFAEADIFLENMDW